MNKKLFLSLVALFLHGCSEFYSYQPPAPIYGKTQTTNPYINSSEKPSRPLRVIEKKVQPIEESQRLLDKTTISTLPTIKPLSPAIMALVQEAEKNSQAGDFESAVSTIERALRIESRNPTLTYKLARLRLKQSKPRLAEDLAKKAALLSAQDKSLKRQSWLLISEARKQQNNFYGAKEARIKADKIL